MSEVVTKIGLPKPEGFLYFVEMDGTVWKHVGGEKELVYDKKFEREIGYLYFIDLNGDLARLPNNQMRDPETNELYKPGSQVIESE